MGVNNFLNYHGLKSAKMRSFPWFKYGKIRTRKTPYFDTFHTVYFSKLYFLTDYWLKNYADNCFLDKAAFKYSLKELRSLVAAKTGAASFELFCSMNIFQQFFQGISRDSLPCIFNHSSKRLFRVFNIEYDQGDTYCKPTLHRSGLFDWSRNQMSLILLTFL